MATKLQKIIPIIILLCIFFIQRGNFAGLVSSERKANEILLQDQLGKIMKQLGITTASTVRNGQKKKRDLHNWKNFERPLENA